jgi:hypothetical protein
LIVVSIPFDLLFQHPARRNVTFPARQYSVNGERRSFALLRPVGDSTAQNAVRDRILEAYVEFEQAATSV